MTVICYAACAVALFSALMVVTRRSPMHALLYLILMLLALGLVFFTLGAPFVAVLQIVVYAGAIMVLFVFVVMMLNLGPTTERREARWLSGDVWFIPALLTVFLLILSFYALFYTGDAGVANRMVSPKEVGKLLYTDYVLLVELASLILTAGLIGAFHLAPPMREREATERATLLEHTEPTEEETNE
jgi:NADH-quinone oxidoreductase subunit J